MVKYNTKKDKYIQEGQEVLKMQWNLEILKYNQNFKKL